MGGVPAAEPGRRWAERVSQGEGRWDTKCSRSCLSPKRGPPPGRTVAWLRGRVPGVWEGCWGRGSRGPGCRPGRGRQVLGPEGLVIRSWEVCSGSGVGNTDAKRRGARGCSAERHSADKVLCGCPGVRDTGKRMQGASPEGGRLWKAGPQGGVRELLGTSPQGMLFPGGSGRGRCR